MRGVRRICILLSAICLQTACIVHPALPDDPLPLAPNTIQDEIEQIATAAVEEWSGGKSAIVCDALYCLWQQELSEKGFPSATETSYRIRNSKNIEVTLRLSKSEGDSHTTIRGSNKEIALPSEVTIKVSLLSSPEGTAKLTADDSLVSLIAEGNDGSLTSFSQSEDELHFEADSSEGEKLFELTGNGSTTLSIKKDARIDISGGDLFDIAGIYCSLRDKASSTDVTADIDDFNSKYSLRVFLRGQMVGDARAEYFCDETGPAVDWVIHYDSETVANSVPYIVFERIRDFPKFSFPE